MLDIDWMEAVRVPCALRVFVPVYEEGDPTVSRCDLCVTSWGQPKILPTLSMQSL